jgi:hypothetical protein
MTERSLLRRLGPRTLHSMAGEIDPLCTRRSRMADGGRRSRDCRSTRVPFMNRDLASDDIGGYSVVENLEQIVTRGGFERLDPSHQG